MNKKTVVCSLKAAAAAFLLAVGLLFLLSFFAYKQEDPTSFLPLFAHLIRFVCAFLCGLLAAKASGEGGLWCGLFSGCLFLSGVILLSLLLSRDGMGHGFLPTLAIYGSMLLLAAVGGVVGVSGREKKKIKQTKRRRPNRHPASS